jgi:hypothetical protein
MIDIRYPIALSPHPLSLDEVQVKGKKRSDFPYELFCDALQQTRSHAHPNIARAYLLLVSESNGSPIEIIEAYGNAEFDLSKGIRKLTLVNGKIGLASAEVKKYISLNSCELIERFMPFFNDPRIFWPEGPGNKGCNTIKRKYNLWISKYLKYQGARHFIISFEPKKNPQFRFSGKAWIDEQKDAILRYSCSITDALNPPFHSLDPNEALIQSDLSVDVLMNSFPGEERFPDRITMQFRNSFQNLKTADTVIINTKAILYLFDPGSAFPEPLTWFTHFPNDYIGILSIPFEPLFWSHFGVMAPSQQQSNILRFFQQEGLLIHYDHLQHNQLSKQYRKWQSDKPLRFQELHGSPYSKPVKSQNNLNTRYDFSKANYQIQPDVLFFPIILSDTMILHSYTFIDLDKAYWHRLKTKDNELFINSLFDIYEQARRQITQEVMSVYAMGKATPERVDSIYRTEMQKAENIQKIFTDAFHQNPKAALKHFKR